MKAPVHADPRLRLDAEEAEATITAFLRRTLARSTRPEGFVVGLSGGVDSAVTLALAARAVGAERCGALLLPERDSAPESRELARSLADRLGVEAKVRPLTDTLQTLGVYRDQEEVLRELFPDFQTDWRYRLVLPGDLRESRAMNVYSLEVHRPDDSRTRRRLSAAQLRRLQAASNVKQRLRMVLLYREAESSGRLVAGTTNLSEYDQGFFVQHGDGGVDLEPIAHLYKQQVRALAHHLGLPPEIADRPASPDTWSEPVGDDEFYFRLPYSLVDGILARERAGMDDATIASELELEIEQVERIRAELTRRREHSRELRRLAPSLLADPEVRS